MDPVIVQEIIGKEIESYDSDVIKFTDGTELWIYADAKNVVSYELKF